VPVEWAGLGPDLLIALDRERDEPLAAQLERELRAAIRSGRLGPGERLPSSRQLARELGVSRGLVLDCYLQLQAEGFLSARSGSGTRVAAGAYEPPMRSAAAESRSAPRIDFCTGVPDLTSFPRADWLWALREAHRTAPAGALGYGDPRGQPALREVLAAYLRRVRGAVADPDRIVVCSGFAQAVNLIFTALHRAGARRLAIEDPGDSDYTHSKRRWRLDWVPIPVDEEGIVVDQLAATSPQAVIVTPSHQFPTGVVLGSSRRRQLTAWARSSSGLIVEDDYDAEFRYDREPVGLLQGLAPEHVAAVGTVSKSLAPGLRLGWIVCPAALVEAVAEEKELADRGSPWAEQLALAAMLESGRFDRHLRRMRGVYAARREALVEALAKHAPGVELSGLAAGFHGVVQLPLGADEDAIVAAARERGVGVYPLSDYRLAPGGAPGGRPGIVLGFGNLDVNPIRRGIRQIAELLV
jgi:GntR family transcriptional regulator / MocR family aminotransferase